MTNEKCQMENGKWKASRFRINPLVLNIRVEIWEDTWAVICLVLTAVVLQIGGMSEEFFHHLSSTQL